MRCTILLALAASLTVAACNSGPETGAATAVPTAAVPAPPAAGDSLTHLALSSFELVSYRLVPDTLELVSTSDFLYHPFGTAATLPAFRQKNPHWTFTRETDRTDPTVTLYRGSTRNGALTLFADTEKKSLEIVVGNLSGPGSSLVNGLAVGVTHAAFFAPFFRRPATVPHSRVVVLVSGLDGIRHYYTFRGDTLAQVVFATDYQFGRQ